MVVMIRTGRMEKNVHAGYENCTIGYNFGIIDYGEYNFYYREIYNSDIKIMALLISQLNV